ncbi:MAG: hypothetical protein Q9163_005249 [Psora crenata]
MKLQPDGSMIWKAPFHPDTPIPWLDTEHDVGPAVLQIFKDGLKKWSGHRIALAFELLSPNRVCALFSRALRRRCTYRFSPTIDIEVAVPPGYRAQLEGLEIIFGEFNAPYFGLDLEPGTNSITVEDSTDDATGTAIQEARSLWGGWRGIEEYAREVFPVEEANNGLTWMKEQPETNGVV